MSEHFSKEKDILAVAFKNDSKGAKISKFECHGEYLLVEPIDQVTITPGGIILPDAAQEKPLVGYVRGVGEGRTLDNGNVIPNKCKVGDMVLYARYSGNEFEDLFKLREESIVEGVTKVTYRPVKKMVLMRERDTMGIIKEMLP